MLMTDLGDTGIDVGSKVAVGRVRAELAEAGRNDIAEGCRVDIDEDAAGIVGNNGLVAAAVAAVALPHTTCWKPVEEGGTVLVGWPLSMVFVSGPAVNSKAGESARDRGWEIVGHW